MDIDSYLKSNSPIIDKEIEKIVPKTSKPFEVYGLIWEFLKRGGKRFRPILCLTSCEAVGGDTKKAMPAAVAIELFHAFTLLHDDLEDDSELRRGKPCLHIIYGVPLAINAGDGMFMLVFRALTKLHYPPEKILDVQKVLIKNFTRVLEGQAVELGWRENKIWEISERDYLKMVEGKTGALISAACEVGGILGNGSKKQIAALKDFGMQIGIAFQIQDDILNLVGTEKKYKKEIGGDITEGKRTLMTIHALRNGNKEKLLKLIGSGAKDKKTIKSAISILKSTSSIDYAKNYAKKIVQNARRKLKIIPNNESRKILLDLADFLINRDY
ncbi:polyprenyl synthetase family protein [Candidatus Micrarchaeota archaeon]|nr:polyprenyl synthetase family protein [Candidatus Micrarchaeota archaeon]